MGKCPEHYIDIDGICYSNYYITLVCNRECKDCSNLSRTDCISCEKDKVLLNGECLEQCPYGFYPKGNKCLPCPYPCAACDSFLDCTACYLNHYLVTGECKKFMKCLDGYYMDEGICKPCSKACLSCYGPSQAQCFECNSLEGYRWYNGECISIVCIEGMYLKTDICVLCNSYCKSCENSYHCIECEDNFISSTTEDGLGCEGCPVGFSFQKGRCKGNRMNELIEVCGDGRNLGQYECDDGNLKDGDGCSSKCKVEEGFVCTSNENSPDTCVDMKAPTARMKLYNRRTLVITFSEPVLSKLNSDLLAETMSVSLNKKCEFTWTLRSKFDEGIVFTELRIDVSPSCSFEEERTYYKVHFSNTLLITDLSDNKLATTTLIIKVPKYLYRKIEEQAKVVGLVIQYASTSTLVLMLGLSIFQGCAVGSVWHFINMLQILSYLPLLDCEIPNNFRVVLSNSLMGTRLVIPFDLLFYPSFNPLRYFIDFDTDPLNEKFIDGGYESISFMANFAEELLTWLLLGLAYLVLQFLSQFDLKYGYHLTLMRIVSLLLKGQRSNLNIME